MKYFIISQPKAGTYLCANLLKTFNIGFEGHHFDRVDYKINDLKTGKTISQTTQHINLSKEVIKDNYLGVGHLLYKTDSVIALKKFKKILLIRPSKEVKESWERFSNKTGRSKTNALVHNESNRQSIADWSHQKDVFVLQFKDMIEKNIKKIDDLQIHLFNKIIYNSTISINQALKMDSITKIKH